MGRCSAFVAKESLAALPPDEFYAYQLLGLQVKTDQSGVSWEFWKRSSRPGAMMSLWFAKTDRKFSFPATDEVVVRVDVGKKEMTVRLLEGLLPEDDL